jgi:thiosulfate/3-mercaptopyruvate sulfurtransferase
VVSLSWWREHRGDVLLADVRWYLDGRSGRDAYGAGHLPGAVFVDLDRWLAAPASPRAGRHPLPDPAVFADGMARLGIADDSTVVAYDDAGGTVAARLVWMLRVTGHPAALLDGGFQAYDGPPEETTAQADQAAPPRPPARFTPRPWPDGRLASIEDAADPAHVVLDARDRARYRGDTEPVDPRPGHIPGARSLPCRENLAADGTFLPVPELRERLAGAGVTEDASVVCYCGSGVTACHDLLTLEHAGFRPGRLYPGSWSQYSHTSRLAALGDAPLFHRSYSTGLPACGPRSWARRDHGFHGQDQEQDASR